MITFAAIAIAGDVNVNAIAPGIAAARIRVRKGPGLSSMARTGVVVFSAA